METKGTITKETDLLTMEQAADYLGYKKGYLYNLVHFKKIPHLKYGARFVRFRLEDLKEWQQARYTEVPSTEQMQAAAARYCLNHPRA
ncbi:MAG: helix-turn-helix domain-containing protein [Acetobacter sp.]|nr:helix-turn-helix domain-containing protein [Acetobacter sp.]